jgi:predicted lysophospholipase L1 biosynthesis ABC-type transport system permease subunit
VDATSYSAAVAQTTPTMRGISRTDALRALADDPAAALVSTVFAKEFNVLVGDPITVTVPDAQGRAQPFTLRTAGIYTAAAPTVPGADVLLRADALPLGTSPPPAFYLVRAAPGSTPDAVAARLTAAAGPARSWTVTTFRTALAREQSTLAALNLAGLGRIEAAGAIVIAGIGIAVLGAFLVLERRREYAVMRSLGATTRQVLVPPATEGLVTMVSGVVLGVPIGLVMATLSARVLRPLFTLAPPLLRIEPIALGALLLGIVIATGLALAATLLSIARLATVSVLRESV